MIFGVLVLSWQNLLREQDGEGSTLVEDTEDADGAVMGFDDFFSDWETETAAFDILCFLAFNNITRDPILQYLPGSKSH